MHSQHSKRPDLQTWSEIAKYLGVGKSTAQNWERDLGLPIRRLGNSRGQVRASPDDLDHWKAENFKNEGTAISRRSSPVTEAISNGETMLDAEKTEDDSSASDSPGTSPEQSRPKNSAIKSWRLVIGCGVVIILILIFALHAHFSSKREIYTLTEASAEAILQTATSKSVPLMTDGKLLYVQESSAGKVRIIRTDLYSRSDPESIETSLDHPDPGVVKSDGSAMLLRGIEGSPADDHPLYMQPLPRGPAIRVGEILAYDSAWTPDGTHIVYSKSRTVFETTSTGGNVRKLFDTPGRAYWFRWSPDGHKLRYTVNDASVGTYSLWETDYLYTTPRRLVFDSDGDLQSCCGTWSYDGQYYVFQGLVNGPFQIFLKPENARWYNRVDPRTVRLTSGTSNHRSPLPIEGGRRLVALSQVPKSEVVQYDRVSKRWVPLLDGIFAATAAISKDGKWLAYTSAADNTLWRCQMPDCKNPRQLTVRPFRVTMPQWSPDGSRIACMAQAAGKRWQASTILSAGGPLTSLGTIDGAEADPTWSPLGDEIAYGAIPNPDFGADAQIHRVNLSSKRVQTITQSRGFNTPRWSPDGRYLAAVQWKPPALAVYEFSTEKWRHFPDTRVGYPHWTSDGKRLSFLSLVPGKTAEILELDVASWTVSHVVSLSGVRQPTFSFGNWIGVGIHDNPLALRDLSTEEVLSWRIGLR